MKNQSPDQPQDAQSNHDGASEKGVIQTSIQKWVENRLSLYSRMRNALVVDDPALFVPELTALLGEPPAKNRIWQHTLSRQDFMRWVGAQPSSKPRCVQWALEHGLALAPPSDRPPTAMDVTALMIAASAGRQEWVRTLLPYSNPQFKGAGGFTALMCAVSSEQEACVQALLPASDPMAMLDTGLSVLQIAAQTGGVAVMRTLWAALSESHRQQLRAGAIESAMSATLPVPGVSKFSQCLDFLACALSPATDPAGHEHALAALLLLGIERLPQFHAQQEREALEASLALSTRWRQRRQGAAKGSCEGNEKRGAFGQSGAALDPLSSLSNEAPPDQDQGRDQDQDQAPTPKPGRTGRRARSL